jgi:transcriptional regulator with XRE-family HTH domain
MAQTVRAIIGNGLRAARKARGWSQARLARAGGVSQTLVSGVERAAYVNPPLDVVARLCDALDARLLVEVRPAHVVGRIEQRDPAHAACVAAMRRLLERAGWATASEVEITTGRAHGFIDLLAHHPATGRTLVVEVKTELRDIGALERQLAWYLRESRSASEARGWRPARVAGLVVCLATAAVDAVVIANRAELAAAFPVRGRAVRAALLGDGVISDRGLILIDPARRGAARMLGLAADGRRTPAPYRDYASFMRTRSTR